MSVPRTDFRLLIPSIVITILAIIVVFTGTTALVVRWIGYALSFSHKLASVFWVVSLVVCICYLVRMRNTNLEGKELFVHLLGPVPDLIFSAGSYGMVFHTAIVMLDGLFRQYFHGYEFIKDIRGAELFVIGIPMFCLMFWSLVQVGRLARVAYRRPGRPIQIKMAEHVADSQEEED